MFIFSVANVAVVAQSYLCPSFKRTIDETVKKQFLMRTFNFLMRECIWVDTLIAYVLSTIYGIKIISIFTNAVSNVNSFIAS